MFGSVHTSSPVPFCTSCYLLCSNLGPKYPSEHQVKKQLDSLPSLHARSSYCSAKTACSSVQDFCLVSFASPVANCNFAAGRHCSVSVPQRPTDLPSPLTSPLRQAEEDRNGHCELLRNLELPDAHVTYLARSFRAIRRQPARTWALRQRAKVIRADGEGRGDGEKVRGRGTSPFKVEWNDKKNFVRR